ncbi:MAG: hypothetical protein ACJATA_000882 [Sphingobacteriales bacterium]|jgi:hypothetical protein
MEPTNPTAISAHKRKNAVMKESDFVGFLLYIFCDKKN